MNRQKSRRSIFSPEHGSVKRIHFSFAQSGAKQLLLRDFMSAHNWLNF